jgi:hypothetical protein
VCGSCGWPDSRPSITAESPLRLQDEPGETPKGKRKRKKPRAAIATPSRERRAALPGYAIGTGLVLLLWAGLAALALLSEHAALWLAICGVATTVIAVVWLYQTAAAQGAERMNLLNVTSRGVITGMLLFLIEVIAMPVFSIVYLVLYFDSVWKPFLIEVFGIGMCATGILLMLR